MVLLASHFMAYGMVCDIPSNLPMRCLQQKINLLPLLPT